MHYRQSWGMYLLLPGILLIGMLIACPFLGLMHALVVTLLLYQCLLYSVIVGVPILATIEYFGRLLLSKLFEL